MYGFPVSIHPFQSLEESQLAVSTNRSQIQDRLIDPRTTRLARQQVARRDAEQGTLEYSLNKGIFDTVPIVQDVQGTLTSGGNNQPVTSGICQSFFPDSLSVSPSNILTL